MTIKFLIASTLALAVIGCSKADNVNTLTPDQSFRAYNQLVVDGISFEDSKLYHSKAMTAKVEKQIAAMQKSNNKSLESILAFYTTALQSMAKCAELTLASEKIEGETAYLIYDRKNICDGDKIRKGGEEITMVYENGWKVDDNLTKM